MGGTRLGDRALVLGGSMAGMFAAVTLAEFFAEVVVVERDQLDDTTVHRRGVPHGPHAHGLLGMGQQLLERHFPGIYDELRAAGTRPGDVTGDIRWYFGGRMVRQTRSGLLAIPAHRPVLEAHVRRRTAAVPNVRFLEGHDILSYLYSGGRITGARVLSKADNAPRDIAADLVVDTTGRGSRTPALLEAFGYARPPEERIKVGLAYTTRHFELRSDPFGADIAIMPVATPTHPRGAFFYRLPGGDGTRVKLSLTGIVGDHPPTDPAGFLSFVETLPVPEIYEAVLKAEPIDDAVTFSFPASVWRRYHRLDRFPEGLLVMGDAVCSFNPVYGQGITVAGLESVTLQRHLRTGSVPSARAFFRDVARDCAAPWQLSAGADLGYPGVVGRRTPMVRIGNAYMSRLQRAASVDPSLTDAFFRTATLVDSPGALLRPRNLVRVIRNGAPSE